ncbi:MAG: membrane protein [Mycobacteriales bacterium]
MTAAHVGGRLRSRVAGRVVALLAGLVLIGTGAVLTLKAALGVSPWDVLHAGIAARVHLGFGTVVIVVGAAVLAGSLLLGVRPGWGTIVNLVVIGWVENVLLAEGFLSGVPADGLVVRAIVLVTGIIAQGFGCALYIGAAYGAGPRDGLMVGVHHRYGVPVGLARAVVELAALAAGVALGGPVGVGTLLFALGIGPVVQVSFRLLGGAPRQETAAEPT